MNSKEKKNAIIRKFNIKLYPNYMMLSYNLLFYYGINIMFLSDAKSFTDSQILLSNTMFAIFLIILQLPVTLIIAKIGNKHSAMIGNLFNVIWGVIMIFLTRLEGLMLAQFIRSFAVSIKYIAEPNLLGNSIPLSSRSDIIHSNITKKGYQRYYILQAITTVLAGFIYEINPYIPIILSMVCSCLSIGLASGFTDIRYEKQRKNNEIYTLNKYYKDLVKGLRFTFTSKRLLSLFLFTGIIYGTINLSTTYELAILQYLGMAPKLIGIFYAVLALFNGIFSRDALKFNNIHQNRSLTTILIQYSISFILIGIVTIINVNDYIKAIIIVAISIILASLQGVFSILQKKYFNSFSTYKISASVNSAKHIIDNTFIIITTYIGSLTLMFYNVGISIILVGAILIIIAIVLFQFSKTKLGLKPTEYSKKDIPIK